MEFSTEIVNGVALEVNFAKSFILEVWQRSEYASVEPL